MNEQPKYDTSYLINEIITSDFYKEHNMRPDKNVLEAIAKVDRREFIPDKFGTMCIVDPHGVAMIQHAFVLMAREAESIEQTKQKKSILIIPGEEKKSSPEEPMQLLEKHLLPVKMMVPAAEAILQTAKVIAISQKELAYNDMVLEIGYNQTCSQPSITAFMLDKLELDKGMKVLEVGAGCGYSAAIVSHIISPHMFGSEGYLVAMECLPPLAELAKKNLEKHFGIEDLEKRIKIAEGDGSLGFKEKAPYDRIYLTAGVDINSFNPLILAEQLNPEKGILLFPEQQGNVIKQVYVKGDKINEEKYYGVQFVPLRGKNS